MAHRPHQFLAQNCPIRCSLTRSSSTSLHSSPPSSIRFATLVLLLHLHPLSTSLDPHPHLLPLPTASYKPYSPPSPLLVLLFLLLPHPRPIRSSIYFSLLHATPPLSSSSLLFPPRPSYLLIHPRLLTYAPFPSSYSPPLILQFNPTFRAKIYSRQKFAKICTSSHALPDRRAACARANAHLH